ncbi:MAG: signal peptidase I [Clostridia bacterium]|nr:signal peptidase I [Clostridia bacterium]
MSKKDEGNRRKAGAGVFLTLGLLLFSVAVLASLVLVVPAVMHVKSYAVASGSMEPAMPVGSLVLVRKVDPENLKAGDIIVFGGTRSDGENVTHRVVENDQDQKQLTTKGDANDAQDPDPVAYDQVVGQVIWHAPKAGTAVMYMQSWYGKAVIVAVLIAGFLLVETGLRVRTQKELEKELEERDQKR